VLLTAQGSGKSRRLGRGMREVSALQVGKKEQQQRRQLSDIAFSCETLWLCKVIAMMEVVCCMIADMGTAKGKPNEALG